MKYKIANREELDKFLSSGDDYYSIRGKPPSDMTYDEYPEDFIVMPINIAWVNGRTGKTIDIVYEPVNGEKT